jgi:hypothetical protein
MEPSASEPSVDSILKATDYGDWIGFTLLTFLLLGVWYFLNSAVDIVEVKRNWPKYRCSPSVMPFAGMYGYDVNENFQFCLRKIFEGQVGEATGPFATIMGGTIGTLMTFLKNLNSIRVMLATLVGGVSKIFQEFSDRLKLAMSQIRITGLRMQTLMKRVFATFFAVIYMGLSLISTGQNFGNSFIFRFLDIFCFDPDTPIPIEGKGSIPIKDVGVGDRIQDGPRVTSTYRFKADGQPMVQLGSIVVSTNHYVQYEGRWVQSSNHPDAVQCKPWSGGDIRPLVCLDTETHTIPLGGYVFSDWDETDESDVPTMRNSETALNGKPTAEPILYKWYLQPAVGLDTQVRMADGSTKTAALLQVGDQVSTGEVTGVGLRTVKSIVYTEDGTCVTPSTLVWTGNTWKRAGFLYETVDVYTTQYCMRTFVVRGGASIETSTGEYIRDMMEVWSPDMETPTTEYLKQVTLDPVAKVSQT